jgi:Ulp1 family protease
VEKFSGLSLNIPAMAKQSNGFDCGVFNLVNAKFIIHKKVRLLLGQ